MARYGIPMVLALALFAPPAHAARTIYAEPYDAPKVVAAALMMQKAVTIDGKLEISVKTGAKIKDVEVKGGSTSFILTPDGSV
ncbi:MAG: hypothetical protein QGD94_06595, partial [Planctomycetia bacterium]|nr:hypothetical protein [Planctomycetia bacterium]